MPFVILEFHNGITFILKINHNKPNQNCESGSGWQTTLFATHPVPDSDCEINLARGINDVPPGIEAINSLLNQFGDGDLGETVSVYAEFVWNIAENWELTAGAPYIHRTKDSYFTWE